MYIVHNPEWDGEPADPIPPTPRTPRDSGDDFPSEPSDPKERPPMLQIKLRDGKIHSYQENALTRFFHYDKPITAQQFLEILYGKLPDFFTSEADLRAMWSDPTRRAELLQHLSEAGFSLAELNKMQAVLDAKNSDLFDVLGYIAYALPMMSREARAAAQKHIRIHFTPQQQEFLDFVLTHYIDTGVEELAANKLSPLILLKYKTIDDAKAVLGPIVGIREVFMGFQSYLYEAL